MFPSGDCNNVIFFIRVDNAAKSIKKGNKPCTNFKLAKLVDKPQKRNFDQQENNLFAFMEMVDQRVASLEQDAQQPRLAMEADGPADTKTCERTEGAAKVTHAMHRNSCSANRVDSDPVCSTNFDEDCTGPLALPFSREDAPVPRLGAGIRPFRPRIVRQTTPSGDRTI